MLSSQRFVWTESLCESCCFRGRRAPPGPLCCEQGFQIQVFASSAGTCLGATFFEHGNANCIAPPVSRSHDERRCTLSQIKESPTAILIADPSFAASETWGRITDLSSEG